MHTQLLYVLTGFIVASTMTNSLSNVSLWQTPNHMLRLDCPSVSGETPQALKSLKPPSPAP